VGLAFFDKHLDRENKSKMSYQTLPYIFHYEIRSNHCLLNLDVQSREDKSVKKLAFLVSIQFCFYSF